MATGTGKTVVMAMLIAWQTLNKVQTPRDARFAKRFLVVTPGITIRDRLRVLLPERRRATTTDERDLVPADLWAALDAGADRDHELPRVPAARTPRRSRASRRTRARSCTATARRSTRSRRRRRRWSRRVLRDLGGRGKRRDRRAQRRGAPLLPGQAARRAASRRRGRQGSRGAQRATPASGSGACRRSRKKVGHQGDLRPVGHAVLPQGLRLQRGLHLPVGGERLLADGRDRVGHREGAAHPGRRRRRRRRSSPTCTCGTTSATELPKRKPQEARRTARLDPAQGARRRAAAASTAATSSAFEHWETELAQLGEPPPVFIVVCPNTVVSKLVYDWIAGEQVVERRRRSSLASPASSRCSPTSSTASLARAAAHDPHRLGAARVRRGDEATTSRRPRPHEIEAFKDEYRRRNPGADVEKITDEDLLREVMNTVGKKGRLGEHVRCVVSASRCSPRAGTPTPSPTSSASARSAASCSASRSSAAACAAARTP